MTLISDMVVYYVNGDVKSEPWPAIVTQATSPMFAREDFWCIAATLADAFAGFVRSLEIPAFWGDDLEVVRLASIPIMPS